MSYALLTPMALVGAADGALTRIVILLVAVFMTVLRLVRAFTSRFRGNVHLSADSIGNVLSCREEGHRQAGQWPCFEV
jgi:hypothetical protein